jgi:hypothetical protein
VADSGGEVTAVMKYCIIEISSTPVIRRHLAFIYSYSVDPTQFGIMRMWDSQYKPRVFNKSEAEEFIRLYKKGRCPVNARWELVKAEEVLIDMAEKKLREST